MGALARITAATLRAVADELDPQPKGSAPRRDLASTTASKTELSSRVTNRRPSSRRARTPRPIGFGLPC